VRGDGARDLVPARDHRQVVGIRAVILQWRRHVPARLASRRSRSAGAGRFDCDAPAARWDAEPVPPLCAMCGGLLRPDVVWFGEMLPMHELEAAMAAARACDLFPCVGTSSLVYPAAASGETRA